MRQFRAGSPLLLILSGMAAWFTAPACAQIGDLPQPVIESTTITPEQTDEIQKYIAPRVADLETGEPAKIKRARDDLESPATSPGATIAFRTAYSDALVPALDGLGKNASDVIVINAIEIAGNLGTGPAIALVERYRADQRPAVRLMAVAALRDTLDMLDRMAPIVGGPDVDHVVANLASGLGTEADPKVVGVYVSALLRASTLRQANFSAIPDQALGELARGIGTRVRKLGAAPVDREMLPAFIIGAAAVRDVVAADRVPGKRPEGLARDAGGLGGDFLAYVLRRVRAGDLPMVKQSDPAALDQAKEKRQVEITIARLGTALVWSARDRLAVGIVEGEPDLAAMLDQATQKGDKDFQTAVGLIIGEGGILTKDPFRFNADRFLGGR